MKYLPTVIDEIVAVAPDLAPMLRSTRDSATYCAPEAMGVWWQQTANLLNEYAADHPKRDEIAAIFGDKAGAA